MGLPLNRVPIKSIERRTVFPRNRVAHQVILEWRANTSRETLDQRDLDRVIHVAVFQNFDG